IQRRVDQQWVFRTVAESLQESPEQWIRPLFHHVNPDQFFSETEFAENALPQLRQRRGAGQALRTGTDGTEVPSHILLSDRDSKWVKRFPMLQKPVDILLDERRKRIRQNAPKTQRARAKLCPILKPPNNLILQNQIQSPSNQILFRSDIGA